MRNFRQFIPAEANLGNVETPHSASIFFGFISDFGLWTPTITSTMSLALPVTAITQCGDDLIYASGSTLHSHHVGTSVTSSISLPNATAKSHDSSLIRQIAVSPDESHIATLSDDKGLRIYSLNPLTLISTRMTTKRGSCISFSPAGDVIASDKVGDVYLYPFVPRTIDDEDRPTTTTITSDPSKNPDADLLLGHVSTTTAHILSPDGRHIITADRDEHIRVSRYPQSFIIERYLFGTNGFVSAIHIPISRPDILISGGGENILRVWNWKTGIQIGNVPICAAVFPHRRVRSSMRRIKKTGKRVKLDENAAAESADAGFYGAPEGWTLPSGQGVCIQKIQSITVGGDTIVVFYSQGSADITQQWVFTDLL